VADNFSVKAEYIYDCISAHYKSLSTPAGRVGFNTRSMCHIARVGLNYHFDFLAPPAPVVAKY